MLRVATSFSLAVLLDPARFVANHRPAEAAAFRTPSLETLLAYVSQVRDETKQFLGSLTEAMLDETVKIEAWGGELAAKGDLLFAVLKEWQQHAGQVAYSRGILRGHEG